MISNRGENSPRGKNLRGIHLLEQVVLKCLFQIKVDDKYIPYLYFFYTYFIHYSV